MDTISSRENSNILPVAGVIIGVIALLLSIIAFVKVNSANTKIAAHDEKLTALDTQVSTASASAGAGQDRHSQAHVADPGRRDPAQRHDRRSQWRSHHQDRRGPEGPAVASAKGKFQRARRRRSRRIRRQEGRHGRQIARANGCSLPDLQAVNPNVNWTKLKIGDKIKLPKK
jgi:hypothetical protein